MFKLIGTDPKYRQRDYLAKKTFDRGYTYIYRYTDKDTESFKIFFMRPFYSAILGILGNNIEHYNNMWNKYSKHPLVLLLDHLHHTAEDLQGWGSNTILYTLKLGCDTHLAKLLSTFNFKT